MTIRSPERSWRRAVRRATGLVLFAAAAPLGAQQPTPVASARSVSLEDAVRMAQERSEEVAIARAGATRARGQWYQARSQYLPQLNASVAYLKTLKSQFSALASGGGPDTAAPLPPALCAPRIPTDATAEERAAALAQATTCDQGGGIDFSKVGFGARNQWVGGLQLAQNVYTGGRVTAQYRAAQAGERSAELEITQRRAQVTLDVTQAYYDAALADRMVAIADSTLAQNEVVLQQTTLARRVGNQSEFDLLRAQVGRDNQRPVVIQARSNRQVAYLRLKEMLELPLDESLTLTTAVEDAAGPASLSAVLAAARLTSRATDVAASTVDTAVADRAIVRQTAEGVRAQESLLRVVRSQYLPTISLTSNYPRLFFPISRLPTFAEYSQNWTVGVAASMSLFNGGRIRGEELVARANVEEARQRLAQVQELAALDARVALTDLAQAEATWGASQGTVEQAQRAYRIDEIRYREGIATQTDLAQTRILLQQATANRAVAARQLAVARMKLALLRDLPLQLGTGAAAGASGVTGQGTSGSGVLGGSQAAPAPSA
ncbi:MAG: TolC family protein, partial [Gemmatimonadaceae bacterium]